jgi:uncharacterized membrane protein YoaK (UPF0700 family)
MTDIQTQQDLQKAILQLEKQQFSDQQNLHQHFQDMYVNMQPKNLLKTVVNEITNADELRKDILKAALALAIGFIAKKIFDSYLVNSSHPVIVGFKVIVGIIISGVLTNSGSVIKNIAMYFFRLIINKKMEQQQLLLPAKQ